MPPFLRDIQCELRIELDAESLEAGAFHSRFHLLARFACVRLRLLFMPYLVSISLFGLAPSLYNGSPIVDAGRAVHD
ncbi:hypothetical protein XH97_02735 [Bradyrhizobium sp. CCBAU 53380]|nr:hypothetical protein [Bradyrhizobium sp. CCBAU 53380]